MEMGNNKLPLTTQAMLACGTLAGLYGLTVSLGWVFNLTFLVTSPGGFGTVPFNAALGIFMVGACIWGIHLHFKSTVFVAGLIWLLGLLSLMEYALGIDFNIDQLLVADSLGANPAHPGRMAPSSALSFLLLGTSLLILAYPRLRGSFTKIVRNLAAITLSLSIAAFFTEVSGLKSDFGWGYFISSPLGVYAGFLVLALGVVLSVWRICNSNGKQIDQDEEPETAVSKPEKKPSLLPKDQEFTILYVEDNPYNLVLMKRIFRERKEICLLDAPEAQLGIDLAVAYSPDLILMDINLPGMDGYTALKKLRDHPETQGIPVIAVSANAMESDIQRGIDAGFVSYIHKPINVANFLEEVNMVLNKQSKRKQNI